MKSLIFGLFLLSLKAFAVITVPLHNYNIHGIYKREQVLDRSLFKNRITGLISNSKTLATCTGILIGPKQVLTAAHCVYDFETKEWVSDINFSPNVLSEEDLKKTSINFKKIFVQKEYIETKSEDFDFALIELDTEIGKTLGFAGFRALLKNETIVSITLSGYPGDKETATLWKVTCPAGISGALLSYLCDTYGGMSGSAIFLDRDQSNMVIGVHTFGGPLKNGGVYFDSKNYLLIDAWKNSKTYSENTIVHLK